MSRRPPRGPRMASERVVYRQVHPKWLQEGRATRQAFAPGGVGTMSLTDADLRGAVESCCFYRAQGFESAGSAVLRVSSLENIEINDENAGGSVWSDPLNVADDGIDDVAHARAEFPEPCGSSRRKSIARRLADSCSKADFVPVGEDDC